MLARVLKNFIDKVETELSGNEVLRTVGEEFTVSRPRFDDIIKVGKFVEEVKKAEPKK